MKNKLQKIKEESQELCSEISSDLGAIYHNTEQIAAEYHRVTQLSRAPMLVVDEIDEKFKRVTKLNNADMMFLFVAIGLQCARAFLINKLTSIEAAGQTNKNESVLHQIQKNTLKKFDNGAILQPGNYYAPLNQIITTQGVPYDATSFSSLNSGIFKGANHRFATLGHDPVLGIIFGTANILTNTITCTLADSPIIFSHHVFYDANLKNPTISSVPASTMVAIKSAVTRLDGDESSVAAALIKQIIHIGTDLYTPCGIQLPGANLVLSNRNAEQVTKYISTGDMIKGTASAQIMAFVNFLVGVFHGLTYNEKLGISREAYSIKTRKIILYSDVIASTSNIIWTGLNAYLGNEYAMKDLDIGGLLITIQRLVSDTKFIHDIKKEFLKNELCERITGAEYDFMKGDF